MLALTLIPCAAFADTVVVPNQLAAADEVFGAGPLGAANYRSQRLYGPGHFPEGIALVITELRFRPDHVHGRAFTSTLENVQFNLSTSARDPNGVPSSTYANNIGADDTVVFSGALTLSSQFTGPANGPKAFDIIIPLTTPFLYNPAAGSLLVDIRNYSGGANVSPLSGSSSSGDAASRVGASNIDSPTGGADHGVEAMQIVYTPTNAPPVPPTPVLLTRGPYLQLGTTSNILVRWRTSRNTNSVVRFGLAADALDWAVTNTPPATEHIITLTNLAPDTKYFYTVGGADTNLAGGTNHHFITAPNGAKPTRVWVIGDAGTASHQDSFNVIRDPFGMRDAYHAHASNRYTDVFLMLGDNAYGVGTDEEYSTNMFGTFPAMLRQSVAWSAIGNHDAVNTATYQNIFSLPQNGEAGGVPSGSELYYSFNRGNIHFVCLDSEVSANTPGSPMMTWLEQDLENNTNDWLIAFWHSPPYTYGSHDSDSPGDSGGKLVQMRQNVVPMLEAYGVDLVLCGHSHVYERSFLLDGHYGYAASLQPSMLKDGGSGREGGSGPYVKPGAGPNPNQGAVYVVCGSSGWATPAYTPGRYLNHPAMFIGLKQVGSLVLDVNGRRLDGKFLRNNGSIDDTFTILKGRAPEALSLATFRTTGGTVTAQLKTLPGHTYRIERTPSLGTPDWQPLGGNIIATGATTQWTGTAPGGPENYYRAVLVATP